MGDDDRLLCATGGIAGRLPPEVAAGLGAISRVARALNGPGTLEELAEHALAEMRAALGLESAALYLPDPSGRPVLTLYLDDAPEERVAAVRDELVFDEEAWSLAVASGHPVVFHEAAGWLVENPFAPPAQYWFVLPLASSGELSGVVVAARAVPVDLDATTLTVLRLLGDQLSAGIATARLRQELQRTELERERMRLAAEVHDGLAQDLALAMRELALLESELAPDEARASEERLREAVASANRVVRARLVDLSSPVPIGGLRQAVEDACELFRQRGLPVSLAAGSGELEAPPATTVLVLRILTEALSNAAKHAAAGRVEVALASDAGWLELRVDDDGRGFTPDGVSGLAAGHLGLTVMRQRAESGNGRLEVRSERGRGTSVLLRLPLAD